MSSFVRWMLNRRLLQSIVANKEVANLQTASEKLHKVGLHNCTYRKRFTEIQVAVLIVLRRHFDLLFSAGGSKGQYLLVARIVANNLQTI